MLLVFCFALMALCAAQRSQLLLKTGGDYYPVQDGFSVLITNNNIGLSITENVAASDVLHLQNNSKYNFLLITSFDYFELQLGQDGCSIASPEITFNNQENDYEQICYRDSAVVHSESRLRAAQGPWGGCCSFNDFRCCTHCNNAKTARGRQNVIMKYPAGWIYASAQIACEALGGGYNNDGCSYGRMC